MKQKLNLNVPLAILYIFCVFSSTLTNPVCFTTKEGFTCDYYTDLEKDYYFKSSLSLTFVIVFLGLLDLVICAIIARLCVFESGNQAIKMDPFSK